MEYDKHNQHYNHILFCDRPATGLLIVSCTLWAKVHWQLNMTNITTEIPSRSYSTIMTWSTDCEMHTGGKVWYLKLPWYICIFQQILLCSKTGYYIQWHSQELLHVRGGVKPICVHLISVLLFFIRLLIFSSSYHHLCICHSFLNVRDKICTLRFGFFQIL